jgi:hypothetical protein
MNTRLRSVGAVVAGIIGAYAIITAIELLTSRMYPMPAGVGLNDMAALREWIRQLPPGAFAMVLAGWTLGAFVGGMLTARLAPRSKLSHALVFGVLLLAVTIWNLTTIPHPVWMWVGAFVLLIPAAYVGARVIDKKTTQLSPG